jgi:hypothetical protein
MPTDPPFETSVPLPHNDTATDMSFITWGETDTIWKYNSLDEVYTSIKDRLIAEGYIQALPEDPPV